MNINTRLFGEIEVDDNKVITFEQGIIGFDEFKRYLIIHDIEDENSIISWLQSVEEPELALPIMDPLKIKEDYNPVIEDELLKPLGSIVPEEMLVLVTVTVPTDIKKITANLKAPIIINTVNLKACQLIVDDAEYIVKYPIFNALTGKDGE